MSAKKKKRRRRARPSRFRVVGCLQLVVWVLLGTAVVGVVSGLAWAETAGPGSGQRVELALGSSARPSDVARELASRGLVKSPRLFSMYLRFLRPGVRFDPGPHLLRDDLSARELVARLARSPGRDAARVAIPEGWTRFQIADRLDGLDVCTRAAFLQSTVSLDLLAELKVEAPSAEGYLFPATYRFQVDSHPDQVVRRLIAELRKRLQAISIAKRGGLQRLERDRQWGELQVLTLASMVEREAANPKERATIAGVFLNRLDDPEFLPRRMLQSDPTAGYGCLVAGDTVPSCRGFTGKITPEMLRDSDNPYNTYKHAGLPPGPIANPGAGAIEAVLEPAKTDFYYFVATGDGRHAFSRTLEEHEAATKKSKPPKSGD